MNNWLIRNISLVALLLLATLGFAQSNTRGTPDNTDTTVNQMMRKGGDNAPTAETHKMLLIPFYPKLCMSEIDKDVNQVTHQDYANITEDFRSELDLAIYGILRQNYYVVSLLKGSSKSDTVLDYIYGSTGYQYDLIPGAVPDIAKASDSAKKSHYIRKGQLEVPVDYSKRFMNVVIQNPKLLPYLYKKFHTDTFVFINELDIKNVDNQSQDLTDDTYRRLVSVHYSIIDKDGHYVAKGVVTTYFPFKENNPAEIGEKYFTELARAILKDYKQELTINKVSDQQKQDVKSK